MIIFQTLKWGNMFSYGKENVLELNKSSVTQLIGANGNGKSSIPLIVEESLFNKNSKGTKRQDILNRNQKEKSYWVELTFTIDDIPYSIYSKRASTHTVKLTQNGVDISGHTATQTLQKMEELVGFDFKTFSQVVYQNSSSSLQFLIATDTNRKKFLIDLLALEKYVEMFEVLKDTHKEVSDRLATIKTSYTSTQSWLDKYNATELKEMKLVDIPEFPKDLEIELSSKKSELQNADAFNKRVEKNQQYKDMRNKLQVPAGVGTKTPTEDLATKLGALQSELSKSKSLTDKIKKLGHVCPTCEQEIREDFRNGLIKSAEEETNFLSTSIQSIQEDILQKRANNEKVSKNEKILAEFEKYSGLIDSTLPSSLKDKEELVKGITELDTRINTIMSAIKFATTNNQNATVHNSKIHTIKEQMDAYKDKLNTLSVDLENLTEELSYLEVLKKAFSTNGLLAYKIESSVKELEALSNFYLTELSSGRFQISYTINNDKLNVIITDNGNDVSIEALSAGELARVTTSTLLAIRKLMATISKSKINILFLDETIDTLDVDGKEKLIEILLNEPDINVFLVSHGFTHPLLDKVTVLKENNISRLED